MFVNLRRPPSFVRWVHPRPSSAIRRSASTSSARPTRDFDEDDEGEDVTKPKRRQSSAQAEDWLNGDGLRFKNPKEGPNWLGGHVPFPMNPSFTPLTPISNTVKTKIYYEYTYDPQANSIRALSNRYGISIKRIDAIIRLKQLEEQWTKGKELQTGFQEGMARMLGPYANHTAESSQENAMAADLQADEGQDEARDRYQRSFWEPVAEDEEPIVQRSIEEAKDQALSSRILSRQAKQDPVLMTGSTKQQKGRRPPKKVVVATGGPEKPEIQFVDVGGKFLDVADRTRRLHEASRRKSMRVKSSQ